MSVQDAIDELNSTGANLRCKRLVKMLESLGFVVKSKKSGGHKSFMHPDIRHFHGGNFDCGHGRDPEVKKVYIGIVKNILITYQHDLEQIN